MANYNAKNYTEQGGEVTHIGGKVVFDAGGEIVGPILNYQEASEAESVADLRDDFNRLLKKLKGTGIMVGDMLQFTGFSATVDNKRDMVDRGYNAGVIRSVYSDGLSITLNLSVPIDELSYYAAGDEGIHQWLGIALETNVGAVESIKLNGKHFTDAQLDMFRAMELEGGSFVLWVKADEIKKNGHDSVTIEAYGYRKTKLWIFITKSEEP